MSQINPEELLKESCEAMGLQTTVQIVNIQRNGRWILAYDQEVGKPHFAHAMIELERLMKRKSGQEIELLCESLEDKNKRHIRTGRAAPKLVSERGVEKLD